MAMLGEVIIGTMALALHSGAQEPGGQVVGVALDALHSSASAADGAAFFERLDPDVVWIGSAASDRWTRTGLQALATPLFEAGEGWTVTARARQVWLAPDPCDCLAWADEELESDVFSTAVGNALMRRGEDGEWRVWRYALTYPIPNDLARDMTDEIKAWEADQPPTAPRMEPFTDQTLPIYETLDALHQAAADADGAIYFGLFTPDAVYRGTDVTELWTLSEFRAFAEPYFSRGRGWTYVPRERHVDIAQSDCACVAWFDEVLDSQSYGTSRGTGVMVRGDYGAWRIAYYALTFPIPNELLGQMSARIRAAEPALREGVQ